MRPSVSDAVRSSGALSVGKKRPQLTRVRNVTLCSIFFAAVTSTVAPAASGRMAIQSHPDLGGKCIDVPNAQFSQGARLQMWACASIVWGQPNTEVTLGIVRKSGRSDIRVRLGDSATPGPLAQVFTYDEASQQIKIGSLCVEVLGSRRSARRRRSRGLRGEGKSTLENGDERRLLSNHWAERAVPGAEVRRKGKWRCTRSHELRGQQDPAALGCENVDTRRPRNTVAEANRRRIEFAGLGTWDRRHGHESCCGGTGGEVRVGCGGRDRDHRWSGPAHPSDRPRPSSATAPGCSRYIPSAGLTVEVPCEAYLEQKAEAKREAQKEAEAKRLRSPASAQERWAAIVPNNEVSSSVVWAATKDQARHLAIDACRKVSQTCASGPTDTKEMKDMFAVMFCTRPTVSCAVAVEIVRTRPWRQ